MTKVLVLGAGGIIGQHMMQNLPENIEAIFCKRQGEVEGFCELDITKHEDVREILSSEFPDVIINLAGENRVDVVEENPDPAYEINVEAVTHLADECRRRHIHLVQGSTQGVFSGKNAPYSAKDTPHPITEYGKQKVLAEQIVDKKNFFNTIARITFVLGVRPLGIGRENPLEQMLKATPHQKQVDDRWFSPSFAGDVADQLWQLAYERPAGSIHLGIPMRVTRYAIATHTLSLMGYLPTTEFVEPVNHSMFPGLAQRPVDTTWAEGSRFSGSADYWLEHYINIWRKQNELR